MRRAVALGALLVVIVLIAIGVHSCQVSANNSALQSYTSRIASLIQDSNTNGNTLFQALSTAGHHGASATQTSVNNAGAQARSLLNDAKQLGVPGQMSGANSKLLLTLRMRADGIDQIASRIQPAMGGSSAAVDAITLQIARFYASDVVYKDYAAPEVYAAMNGAGVRFAGLPQGQFVPSLTWLSPSNVASALHVSLSSSKSGKLAPGTHGHQLNSVSIGSTTLQPGSPNSVTSSTPTFTLHFANTGQNPETGVVCKVSINGTSISATTSMQQTTEPGKSYTCDVPLTTAAPAGTQTVVAEVEPVRGEKNKANNSISYTVTFP